MGLQRRAATGVVRQEGEGNIWPNLKEGEYEGRLVMVADLGLQAKDYKGEFQGNFQQISLGIEILGEGIKDPDSDETLARILWCKPFYIYSTMGGKSKEFEYYKAFCAGAEAETVPEWEEQLGAPCNVYVSNVRGKGDSSDLVFDNITSITAIPAKYRDGVDAATVEFAIGDGDEIVSQLRGLAKYVYEHQIKEEEEEEEEVAPVQEDVVDVDEDVPY